MTYFNQLLNQKDNYLRRNNPAYERVLREHPFWHSVYIGFGFLNNDYGIKYKDEVAIEKVRSISPKTTYLSEEYEAILKEQVLKLIKTKPLFVLRTIFAKFGVISLYLLIFANVGLIAVYFHRKCWPLETAFWGAMIFNSLFGVLVIPDERYLTGFITFATLYGIISIEEAIEHIPWGRFGALLRRKGEEL